HMAAKTRGVQSTTQSPETLLELTADSPLLLIGTVQDRRRLRGNGAKGPWEMLRVEIRGKDGRTQSCVVNGEDSIPAVGSVCVLPVFVGSNGGLREARNLGEKF
ncbi:MAG: hypothetical protein ACREDH_15015, partial [Methylocella sp.]